jgi:phthiocerol/phenolphthiocerol synthesis type-I polyketide synthase E
MYGQSTQGAGNPPEGTRGPIFMTVQPFSDSSIGQIAVAEDAATKQLTRIWQDLLGIDSIGPEQNYFDLGGDSSLAVHLFVQIEQVFKVKLPLATLFEAPTIGELARILRRETSQSGWSPLVPIQTAGSRPPFFCVHGAGGNVLIYRDLAKRLGSDQPFYGLQAPGLDGSCEPLGRVEDMAALYAREIRRIQPRGPYFLGGYCGGGTIAFEVAQQIQAQGERVALLAMFDTMNWSNIPLPTIWDKGYYSLERLVFHAGNVLRLDQAGRSRFLKEKAKILRSRIPVWRGMLFGKFDKKQGTDSSKSLALAKIWQANDRACQNYVPRPYPGLVTDFRPLKQYRAFNRPDAKWDRLAQGGLEIVVLPLYPAGMLVEPFVQHLAAALEKAIDDGIRKCGAI